MTNTGGTSTDSPAAAVAPRPALPGEAAAIVDRIRCAIPAKVLPLTPVGQTGAPAWVADEIRASQDRAVPRFVVTGSSLRGVAEWRQIGDALFLNQITVRADARRRGVASRLLLDGLRRVPPAAPVRLDVFSAATVALDWYRRLGFSEAGRRCWLVQPTAASASQAGVVVQNPVSADATHDRYGFSQIDVHLPSGEVAAVGCLGSNYFRITAPRFLHDLALRTALHRLDAHRQMLYVGPVPDDIPPEAEVVARSIRHEAPAGSLLARLTADSPSDASA
jgi:GNAT superfamily N-acetyltransferase